MAEENKTKEYCDSCSTVPKEMFYLRKYDGFQAPWIREKYKNRVSFCPCCGQIYLGDNPIVIDEYEDFGN